MKSFQEAETLLWGTVSFCAVMVLALQCRLLPNTHLLDRTLHTVMGGGGIVIPTTGNVAGLTCPGVMALSGSLRVT